MRKALGTMSLRLSALCAGTGQGKLLHNLPASKNTLRHSEPRICTNKGIRFSAHASTGTPARMFAAQTQSAVRPTQTSAYAAQYGYDQAADETYVVEKMDWNSMAANAVSLIGNTGKDVEIKRLETGRVVGNLALACAHRAGQTTWYDVDIWGPMAERVAEQVPKGSNVCVQGKLNPASWTDREGKKQTKWKITATEVRFVDRAQGLSSGQQQGGRGQGQPQQAGWGQGQAQPQQEWGAASESFEQAPPPGSEWAQTNTPSQQAASAGPLSKESSAEDKWKSVFDNPNLWWNNTANKRNPKAPDFKLKSDPSGQVVLWINSRDTPDWARQKLESRGVAPTYQPSSFTDMN